VSGLGHAAIAWCSAAGSGRAQQCWGIRPVIARGMARPVACCIFADASLPGSGGHVPVVGEEFVTFLRGLAGADGRLPRWTDCGTNTTSHRCSRTRRPVGQSPASTPAAAGILPGAGTSARRIGRPSLRLPGVQRPVPRLGGPGPPARLARPVSARRAPAPDRQPRPRGPRPAGPRRSRTTMTAPAGQRLSGHGRPHSLTNSGCAVRYQRDSLLRAPARFAVVWPYRPEVAPS